MLITGGVMKEVSGYIGLPYTSLITIIGVALGILSEVFERKEGETVPDGHHENLM